MRHEVGDHEDSVDHWQFQSGPTRWTNFDLYVSLEISEALARGLSCLR